MNTVLVCAAHPDDEMLGCGATMAKHAAAGDAVHVLIMGGGVASRGDDPAAVANLKRATQRASEIVGAASLEMHDFPDNRMDTVDRLALARVVEAAIARLAPSIVYTHHHGDMNVDHGRVHDAVAVACRSTPQNTVRTLLFFEVPSSTEWRPASSGTTFAPNWFVDVSSTLDVKLRALEAYAAEMRPFPHPRSREAVEHLARWRGATAGVQAAEAFILGRQIIEGRTNA
jgi:N-acetylglucosamine malate deacetylase 1